MKIIEKPFGKLSSGAAAALYTIVNAHGTQLSVTNYGAIITSLKIPAAGNLIDVVMGFDSAEDYERARSLPAPPYFGAVAGRYAGRIAGGSFRIDDRSFQLNKNNGNNALHGGNTGFDAMLWDVVDVSSNNNTLTLQYISAGGEEGFPGELTATVKYILTDANEIIIEYSAATTEDTIVNLTQHSYFNLDGHAGSISEQLLKVYSDQLLEIHADNIPTGNIIGAGEKGFDFTKERPCPPKIDDSFILIDHPIIAATLRSRRTGLIMTVSTDQPSIHIYVGGDCSGMTGKAGTVYHSQSGICFETQNYPDAPNQPTFPNAVLRKGEIYRQSTTWKFINA